MKCGVGCRATFDHFAERIRNLPTAGPTESDLERHFKLESGQGFQVFYAPVEWVNTEAKLIIVGITPGEHTRQKAFCAATTALLTRAEKPLKLAKQAAIFSNARNNLVAMLDGIWVNKGLGIGSCVELFDKRSELLHATSCIRYPVSTWDEKKKKWVNFTGHTPKLLSVDVFAHYVECQLAAELRGISKALIVPCGKAVEGALKLLVNRGLVAAGRSVLGFPHPSPANGHRKKQFEKNRLAMIQIVKRWYGLCD